MLKPALVLLLLLSSSPLSARPFLWQIAGDTPSYLFGTIHLTDPRVSEPPPEVAERFAACDVVLTEIPMDPESIATHTDRMLLGQGNDLTHILDTHTLQRLDAYLQRLMPGISAAPLLNLRVWALAVSLLQLEDQLKHPDAPALDLRLYLQAQAAGKQVGGLESFVEQIGYFEELSVESQINLLHQTLDFLEQQGESATEQALQWYLRGEEEKLEQVMTQLWGHNNSAESRWMVERLINHRNHLMAKRIVRHLSAEPGLSHCIAVGAAHLIGSGGLPALLRAQGLRVERVE